MKRVVYEWREAPGGEFAVIGDPIEHSWSPKMHAAAYQELGLPYAYHAIRVPLEEFGLALAFLSERGYRGLNVTTPLKEAAFSWAQEIDTLSVGYGALNTLSLQSKSGTNTDVPGFLETLEDLRVGKGASVLLLGAGGSARALSKALDASGYHLSIFNRTKKRAEELVSSLNLGARVLDKPELKGVKLVINATTSSLSNERVKLFWEESPEDCIAYDLMYSITSTPFLQDAIKSGKKGVDGRYMLVAQGALSFEWWLNTKAPRGVMLDAL